MSSTRHKNIQKGALYSKMNDHREIGKEQDLFSFACGLNIADFNCLGDSESDCDI